MSRLCAFYLMHAKRDGKLPLDPVARFHLANGARLQRLNWMGDTSSAGLARSLGFTVNYVYRLTDVERNHEAYAKDCVVAASPEFRKLAELGRRANGPGSTACVTDPATRYNARGNTVWAGARGRRAPATALEAVHKCTLLRIVANGKSPCFP